MKSIFLVAALLGAASAQGGYFYSAADEDYNIDEIVSDPDSLQGLTDCFLERKPCNKAEETFRVNIPDALAHGCKRCTTSQKHLANTYIRALRRKLPKDYIKFLEKYDPQGAFISTFADKVHYF